MPKLGKTAYIPLGGPARARFVGTGISPAAGTQVLQNVVPHIITENVTGKKALKFIGRNGFATRLFAQAGSFNITRGRLWTGVAGTSGFGSGAFVTVFSGFDGTNVKLYSWDASALNTLGTFAASNYHCIGIQETVLYSGATGVANLTMQIRPIAGGAQKVLYFPNGGALAEITDGDFPTTSIGPMAHMDGYGFIMDDAGNVWNSDLNSLSAWTATSYINASTYPDLGVGCFRMGNLIVAFGTNSIEFFENVGNAAGSPLQRIPQYAKRIGARHWQDILPVGETILFVARSTESGEGVWLLQGATIKKISTPFIDQLLVNTNPNYDLPKIGGFYGTSGSMFYGVVWFHGLQVALLVTPFANQIYGYVVGSEDTWILFAHPQIGVGAGGVFSGDNGTSFACVAGDGVYYTTATDMLNDGVSNVATAYTWKIITEPITHGTGRKKQCSVLRLHCDKQVTAGNVAYRYSDDDGANWSTVVNFDVSEDLPFRTGFGQYRKRIHELSSSTVPCLIDALEEEFEEMES